ncbi:MAG: hypothetical protein K5694_07325 [Bacilli bacterium]|nr:hypothetical protein [Bacilli bacterium]
METTYFNYLWESLNLVFTYSIFTNPAGTLQKTGAVFAAYSGGFNAIGWILYVLFIILVVAALVGLGLLVYILIKKVAAKHGKANNEKEAKMLEEIERLNLELYDAVREKDRLLGLNTMDRVGNPRVGGGKGKAAEEDNHGARFTKLIQIDEDYKGEMTKTEIPADAQDIDLKGICERFRDFACSQMKLYYTIDTVRQFFAAMGTGKLIILEGISGTGKTSMPYCMGRFFKTGAKICSVQPSWRDRSELVGYFNDFTHKFTETEFLASIYDATYHDDNCFIVLDEMNLARIEYYFAEFLSIMEMPNPKEWYVDIIASPREDDPKHLEKGKLLIPQNVWFVGTANNDDSTFTITDKVYDRAMSLFFENKGQPFEANYTEALPLPYDYLAKLYAKAKEENPISQDALDKFEQLDNYVIEHFRLAFGNRIMKQMKEFVPCYVACGGTELEAIDYIFKIKILKKFEVLNVAFLRDELGGLEEELTNLFGPNEFLLSRQKIRVLIKMSK